jgi:hypothetical protein
MCLGIFIKGSGPGARYGHPGDNEGYTARWVSLFHSRSGIVVTTNSDAGAPLEEEIIGRLAGVCGWPDPGPDSC